MNQNVFSYGYRKRYYCRHPIKFLKETWCNLRAAYWRVTRGWAPRDVWSFDTWFLDVVPQQLLYLADKGIGYPGDNEFDTIEKWHDWLREQANNLIACREEEIEKRNEYEEAFMRSIENRRQEERDENGNLTITFSDEDPEIDEKYFARCKELWEEAEELRLNTFIELSRRFPAIWD